MFREMRRTNQQLSKEETIQMFEKGTSGTLALLGDEDYPYAVPISYVYVDGKLFFHGAIEGHKIDAIRKHNKASFCVIEKDDVIPEKFTTYFRSAIAFGKITILEDESQKQFAIEKLGEKYSADFKEEMLQAIERAYPRFCMIELDIEHMTGKSSK